LKRKQTTRLGVLQSVQRWESAGHYGEESVSRGLIGVKFGVKQLKKIKKKACSR